MTVHLTNLNTTIDIDDIEKKNTLRVKTQTLINEIIAIIGDDTITFAVNFSVSDIENLY
jgi:hypothetical protein